MPQRVAREDLERRGFAGKSGFGQKPALVVVDFVNAFTDPEHRLGSDVSKEIEATNVLIPIFRKNGRPVIFTTIEYSSAEEAAASNWRSKIDAVSELFRGSRESMQDGRLDREDADPVVAKKYASAFFGTDLAALLRESDTDTVVVAGCSTSGCVRATIVDACQYGFRAVVCREAVADRDLDAHDRTLLDIDLKYGDVLSIKEIEALLVDDAP